MNSVCFRAVLLAAVALLAACGEGEPQAQASAASAPAPIAASSPMAASVAGDEAADLPDSCRQLLANINKCVRRYESAATAAEREGAVELRLEYEQLKGQLTQGTDKNALAAACSESNRQAQSLPLLQCD